MVRQRRGAGHGQGQPQADHFAGALWRRGIEVQSYLKAVTWQVGKPDALQGHRFLRLNRLQTQTGKQ